MKHLRAYVCRLSMNLVEIVEIIEHELVKHLRAYVCRLSMNLVEIVEIIEHELVKHLKAYVCRSGQLVPEKIYLFHSLSNCLPAANVVDQNIRNVLQYFGLKFYCFDKCGKSVEVG